MHWIDYIIVILSIAAAIVVGMYFAHKQKDTSQYFAGGGKIPAWAVGISIFATLISSVTFLAYPGAAYADNWILLVQGLMVPIVLLALVGIIVPLFRKVIRLVNLRVLRASLRTLCPSLLVVCLHAGPLLEGRHGVLPGVDGTGDIP